MRRILACNNTLPELKISVKITVCPTSSELIWKVTAMAQQCEICGKKPQAGNRISHAHNVTKRRWNINLRPVHAKVAGQGKRMRVCTSCLRSGKVVKA
jgi:large subunit ribosomal protein L28